MKLFKNFVRKTLVIVSLLVLISFIGTICSAEIQKDYAPILYFEGGETCYPVNVSYALDNSQLKTLEGEDIQYYDNLGGTVNDDGVITDYKSKMDQYDYTVYYQVGTDGSTAFVQYWMFYAFNDGEHNKHEGDWEMVEVVIPGNGDEWVAYSQHYSGQSATWNQVEKDETNIKVYVARGSHANYLRSYSGKVGISSDIVGTGGKVLEPSDYKLRDLSKQTWINFDGLWGEIDSINDFLSGSAGPNGPQYRQDMNGNYMWDGVTWGQGLIPANDLLFILEWFLYNFLMIFIILTIMALAIIIFRIYRRHQKYGLGPRIVSMLYIDGLNLKSIGNILCFIGIIIAIIGIFNQWYVVSADIGVEGAIDTDMTDILVIDGLNGVQITMPGANGPTPMGTIVIPFYLLILIGFIFMFISTVGIHKSRKLGMKYLFRGIRLIAIVVVIIIVIMSIGMMVGAGMGSGGYVNDFLNAIATNPAGGEYAFEVAQEEVTGAVSASWGLGIGAIYLLIAGFIFIISGVLEIVENKTFFEPRGMDKTKKGYEPPETPKAKETEKKEKPKDDRVKCPECGKEIPAGTAFCTECGTKLKK